MLKRSLVLVISIGIASSAFAGATVDFEVTDFSDAPCDGGGFGNPCSFSPVSGPFLGGETVLAHVMVTSDADFAVRGAQIDWRASSPELGLGQDIDAVNQPLDGIPNFWFDYSHVSVADIGGTYPATGIGSFGFPTTGAYIDFSNLLQGNPPAPFVAATIWGRTSRLPGMLQIEAGVPFRLGGMPITLPTAPGDYTLDVLNLANTNDSDFGMVLDFGFGGLDDLVAKWASASQAPYVDDSITYANGPLMLTVIPEPVTLILLGVGGAVAARCRQ